MTESELQNRKNWIDNATYQELLQVWRFEPIGSDWFQDELGEYFKIKFFKKGEETPNEEMAQASKNVGWTNHCRFN